jgi:lipopolysaccharide/colanic/teichoic acid biosynthesis glycosyltransferase
VLFLPILLALCALILLYDRMNPLYRQTRKGLGGRPFLIYKLRTMRDDIDGNGVGPGGEGGRPGREVLEPKATRLGEFLRAYSLDELPQLANVIRGEMSLVGPRPFSEGYFRRFNLEAPEVREWIEVRQRVRPGMTGLWQISGRKDLPRDDVITLDLAYVKSCSLRMDLRILLKTTLAVLRRRGAY